MGKHGKWMGVLAGMLTASLSMGICLSVQNKGEAAVKRQVAGFYWVYDDGTEPFRTTSTNSDLITDLCPTWLTMKDADGNISATSDPKLMVFAKEKGIRVLPLIANEGFKSKPLHWVLLSPTRREAFINNLIKVLDGYEYCQGVNLDFEGIDPKDRDLYNEFLAVLSEKLHAKNYLVTIDVPSKIIDNPNAVWSGAFDYEAINQYCDQIMIMTYDEHWSGGQPGPVASVGFVDKCLQYATTIIPAEKIRMGIPFYGYDWPEKGKAKGVHFKSVSKMISEGSATLQWDDTSKTPWFTYRDQNGVTRTCWFENKDSLAAKLEVGKKYNVGGICIWSLGSEDPASWDVIKSFTER